MADRSGGSRTSKAFRLLKDAYSEWRRDNASFLAAGLAYYSIFSISPLLILLVVVAGVILGPEASEGEIVGRLGGFVGPQVAEVIQDALKTVSNPSSSIFATMIVAIVLFIGASGLFIQAKRALGIIWGTGKTEGAIRSRVMSYVNSLSMILVAGFLLLLAGALSAAISSADALAREYFAEALPVDLGILQASSFLVFFVITALLFTFMYKTLESVEMRWGDVFPGAVLTALLFAAGNFLMQLYVANVAVGSVYGAASTLVAGLLWIYYSAQIFFYGAEFIKVYARTYGSHSGGI